MKTLIVSLLIPFMLFLAPSYKANAADPKEVVSTIMLLCIGSTTFEKLDTEGKAEIGLTIKNLKNLGAGGQGSVRFTREETQGLVGGINSAMSEVQASQADKVRECTKHYIAGLIKVMMEAK